MVHRNKIWILIFQTSYVEVFFEHFKEFKPTISSLPIAKGSIFSKSHSSHNTSEIKEMKKYPYRSKSDCLSFIVSCTRLDFIYVVSIFNKFQEKDGF